MNMHRCTLFIILFFSFCRPGNAQYADFVVGFKAGGAFSGLSNLENMIVPEDYFDKSLYSLGSKSVFGAVAGVFVHFRVPETFFAMQPEVAYSMQGSTLSYRDNTDFTYDMGFKYHYVSVALLFKAQVKGLSLRAGPRLGFPVNPEAITYSSNSRQYGEDQDIQQGFRNVMKGRSDFSLGAGLAYEFPFGLGVEAMYYFGLSDTVETLTNSYNFVENSNRSRSVQLTVSYTLSLSTEGKRPR